jgi:hypothetical protein
MQAAPQHDLGILAWTLDGAVLGTVTGAILAGCSASPLLQWADELLFPLLVVDFAGEFVGLWVVLGAVQGALLYALLPLRRFVPADLAPALFAGLGLVTGLSAAAVWLGLLAEPQCGCLQDLGAPEPRAVWLSVILAYGVGSMLVLPLFGVGRAAALVTGGRVWALLLACVASVLIVPTLWRVGMVVVELRLLELPALFAQCG